MRYIVFYFFVLFSTSLFAIDWQKDFQSALVLAKSEHKNVMLMVESEHCRWCKKMKIQTFANPIIAKRLENFIVIKVKRDNIAVMSKLPPIDGVPTLFFLKPNKEMIQEVLGYENVSDFTATLDIINKRLK